MSVRIYSYVCMCPYYLSLCGVYECMYVCVFICVYVSVLSLCVLCVSMCLRVCVFICMQVICLFGVCVSAYVHSYVCMPLEGEGVGFTRAGVIGGFKLNSTNVENWTQVL